MRSKSTAIVVVTVVSSLLLLVSLYLAKYSGQFALKWHAITRQEIFGHPQWWSGAGLVFATILVLLGLRERGWKIMTSLRVTIWTLFLSVILVFLGSLAQVDEGLWDAQERWFKEWFVFIEVGGRWFGHDWKLPFELIYPGGHLLGTILLFNLLAAHARRFVWHFPKAGIQLTHLGIVMLLVGQFLTDELAVESMLSFREGESKQYTEQHRASELVFLKDVAPGQERVVSIPETLLEQKAAQQDLIRHHELPFSVKVLQYQVNGDVVDRSATVEAFGQLTGAMAMVEGRYSSGDLVALAEEAESMDGRKAVWRESLREIGEREPNIVTATQKVVANPELTEKLRAELKKRFRTQMLDANSRRSEEGRYAAEAVAGKRKFFTKNPLVNIYR